MEKKYWISFILIMFTINLFAWIIIAYNCSYGMGGLVTCGLIGPLLMYFIGIHLIVIALLSKFKSSRKQKIVIITYLVLLLMLILLFPLNKPLLSKTDKTCSFMFGKNSEDKCYGYHSLIYNTSEKYSELCPKINYRSNREICYMYHVKLTSNEELCQSFSEEGNGEVRCYEEIGVIKEDASYCENLKLEEEISDCISDVVRRTQKPYSRNGTTYVT